MTLHIPTGRRRPTARWGAALAALAMVFGVAGCDSLIDVENPNNVLEEDVGDPIAASAVASGALYAVEEAFAGELGPYSQAGDETEWSGSRDAWQELMFGTISNAFNEFTDLWMDEMGQGRWWSDEAVEILEGHDADGALDDRTDLARAYLYNAIMYVLIADWFDDFAFSDKTVSGAPIGPSNMGDLYTTAIGRLTSGLAIASGGTLGRNLYGMRARAQHAQAVWNMIGDNAALTYEPAAMAAFTSGAHNVIVVPVTANGRGLVSSTGMRDDAAQAIAIEAGDWKLDFQYTGATHNSDFGEWWFERQENRISAVYGVVSQSGTQISGISLQDPIDAVPDPRLAVWVSGTSTADDGFLNHTQLSGREMNLYLAEHALANGDMPTFQANINTVRGYGGVSNWTGAGGQPTAFEILKHERRVNLFLQGRRLNDMYRFGEASPNWQATREAFKTPGVFLPITVVEILSNCFLNPEIDCD